MHAPRPRRWQRALRTVPGNPPNPLRQGTRALPYRCSFDKRSVGRGPCALPPIIGNFLAMSLRGGPQGRRGPDINRRVCRTHVPYAFGCNPYPHTLALPLGELSPKVTERACRGFRFSLSVGCADSSPKGGAWGQRGNGVSAVPRLNLILPAADSQPPAPPRPRPPGPNSPDPGATSWRSPGTPPPGRSAWPIPRPAAGENYPMRWPPGG